MSALWYSPAAVPRHLCFVSSPKAAALSTTTTIQPVEKAVVIDFDKLQLLIPNTTRRSQSYVPPPPSKTARVATLPVETYKEEATIVGAAAEAVSLARAALEAAKDAAQSIRDQPFLHLDKTEGCLSDSDMELIGTINSSKYNGQDESGNITVKSGRKTERRARRAKAVEKDSSNVISVKFGSSGIKKRSSMPEIDYSDPLYYLQGTTSTSKLLTAGEEVKLSEGIQDLIKLERLQEELAERMGGQPNFIQWAKAAGVDTKTLRRRLNYGSYCMDKMVTSNIRLVISIAKGYQKSGMNLQDLVQEGCRGLIKGAEKFDASKGFKFSTYAHWWIKQSVRKSLSDQSRTIRLPFHMVDATYRVREARKQLFSKNGKYPTNEEIAEATGLTTKRIAAVNLAPKAPISLDQKFGIDEGLKPSEVISDPEASTSEEIMMKRLMKEDLNIVLDFLNPRERKVVRWRFGLEDGRMKTLQEIGDLMAISRERVRQIESSAFRKLKNKKRTKNLHQYLAS